MVLKNPKILNPLKILICSCNPEPWVSTGTAESRNVKDTLGVHSPYLSDLLPSVLFAGGLITGVHILTATSPGGSDRPSPATPACVPG